MQNLLSVMKKTFLGTYARGTFQYDILCALILLFIFATPHHIFQDWPVINSPHQFKFGEQIVDTYDDRGNPVLNVSTELVPAVQDAVSLKNVVKSQLEKTLNRPISIADIKPIMDENGETVGYSIWLGGEKSNAF
jgi:hypothetical protein